MREGYPRVIVMVIDQDERSTLLPCLEALRVLHYPNYEITLVRPLRSTDQPPIFDPGSTPSVTIIQTETRLGIASARNYGLARLKSQQADYVLNLDNDILLQPDCLGELVTTAERHPSAALIAPKIYQNNGRLLSRGGRYLRPIGQPFLLGLGKREPAETRLDRLRSIDFATGAIGLIKMGTLERVGLFDERFDPYGFEDIDWCLRARAAGYQIILNERAIAIHLSDYSFHRECPDRLYETTRKRILLAQKHLPLLLYYSSFVPYFLLRRCLLVVLRLIWQGNWRLIPFIFKASRGLISRRVL